MRTRHVISSLQASFRPQRRREKYQSGQIRTEVSPKWQVAHTDMQPSPGERVWKSWWWIFSSFCLREIPHDKREGQCLSRKLVVTAFNKQRLADISNISNIETFLLACGEQLTCDDRNIAFKLRWLLHLSSSWSDSGFSREGNLKSLKWFLKNCYDLKNIWWICHELRSLTNGNWARYSHNRENIHSICSWIKRFRDNNIQSFRKIFMKYKKPDRTSKISK